jgi:hypothetical protein
MTPMYSDAFPPCWDTPTTPRSAADAGIDPKSNVAKAKAAVRHENRKHDATSMKSTP